MIENYIGTLIYYMIYMISVMLSYIWSKKGKLNWYFILSFTLILGLRGCGIDYNPMDEIFHQIVNLKFGLFDEKYYTFNLNEYSDFSAFEYAYMVLIKVIRLVKGGSVLFFSTIALLQAFFFELASREYDRTIRMLIAFSFFGTLAFCVCFNTVRQMIVVFMFMTLSKFIVQRKFFEYTTGCIVLYLFHRSAIVLWPLYFVINRDLFYNKKITIIIYLICMIGAEVFKNLIMDLSDMLFGIIGQSSFINTNYMKSDNLEMLGSSVASSIVFLSSFLLINLYGDKIKTNHNRLLPLFNMTIIGYFMNLFIFNIGFQRLTYYFFYMSIIILGIALRMSLSDKNLHKKILGVITILLLCLWFVNAVLNGAAGCSPYEFSRYL